MSAAVAVQDVTKTFGAKTAVCGLNLVVPSGSLYGLIGPNGAGKTTAIRMIMSILFPDRGRISVLGHSSALEAKDRIGYLPEERGVYKKMKGGAFLLYMARLKGAEERGLKRRIRESLERLGLGDVEGKKCEELSKGMQQKMQFLAAVIHQPSLLILDEPFSGLDPINMRLLRELILEEHRRGATIIFSTHVMIQAEELCDRVVMIHQGKKVLDEPLSSLRARYDPRVVHFEPLDAAASPEPLRSVPGVERVETSGRGWRIALLENVDVAQGTRDIVAAVAPARVELHRPSLLKTATDRTPASLRRLAGAAGPQGAADQAWRRCWARFRSCRSRSCRRRPIWSGRRKSFWRGTPPGGTGGWRWW
ncbi:MAG: ABC transporter ATP-binding protein [Acidobacteriota bacterium]